MIFLAKTKKQQNNGLLAFFRDKLGVDKNKLITSLLAGFTLPFVLCICSTLNVFFTNADEFYFSPADFMGFYTLIGLGAFAVITLLLLLTKGLLRNILFSLFSGLGVMAFVQTMITTLSFKGLPGDGNVAPSPQWANVLNFCLWVIAIGAAIWFGSLTNKAEKGRTVLSFLLILVLVMQTFTVVPSAITYASSKSSDEGTVPTDGSVSYLTTKDMFQLSKKKNVVVFLVDRFDSYYFDELVNTDSHFFDDFDGFTYYADNISTYPRTYPATTSILTGVDNDFSGTRLEYFEKAYGESTFLRDLKDNNFKINLYIPDYYAYQSASVFKDTVSNVSTASGYTVVSEDALRWEMFNLSSYFWAPEIFKNNSVSSKTFASIVRPDGEAKKYEMNDPAFYDEYQAQPDGVYTQNDQNTFSLYHLRGCHYPYNMDENCNPVEDNTVTSFQQNSGVFKIIREYIQDMKDLGIYEDSTIIITGDHAMLSSDTADLDNPFITALLVKQSGQSGTPMSTSYAPVCQDNMFAEIVKSANIKTNNDYGTAYSDIPEDATLTRTMFFQKMGDSDENVTYEITGSGLVWDNWDVVDRQDIGGVYD